MTKFAVERSIRHRCKTYRISTQGDTVRGAIRSLDNEIAALRRSPCGEDPGPVVLVDDIPRKERHAVTRLEPGLYRAVVNEATVEELPARVDKTIHLVYELIDASMNRLNQFVKDAIPFGRPGDVDARNRLLNLCKSAGVSFLTNTNDLIGRRVGLDINKGGKIAVYQVVGV